MNDTNHIESAIRSAKGLAILVGLTALAAGVATTGAVYGGLSLRTGGEGVPSAHAAGNPTSSGLLRAADSGVAWEPLPSGAFSELVADGGSAWIAVVESVKSDTVTSGVYRITPSDGSRTRVAEFEGRATAAVLLAPGSSVAFSVGQSIIVVGSDGAVRTLAVPQYSAIDGSTPDPISGLASLHGKVYAVSDTAQVVLEVDTVTSAVRTIQLPATFTPPTHVVAREETGELILSTPYRVGDLFPMTGVLDPLSGAVVSTGPSNAFVLSPAPDGTILGPQSQPGGGVVAMFKGSTRLQDVSSRIPWAGKLDQLSSVTGSSFWGAPYQGGALYFEDLATGVVRRFGLPSFSLISSVPKGTMPVDTSTVSVTIDTMVTLNDGSVVFASASPVGNVGWINRP